VQQSNPQVTKAPAADMTQVKKAAPPSIKKAIGGKKTGGWLGGAGGAQDLDKWYGERPALPSLVIQTTVRCA
jgi:hypothetical protein